MPKPINEKTRAKILADICAGEDLHTIIAKRHGVSVSTVRKIAKEARDAAGFTAPGFDAKAARTQLIRDLYTDAQRFRERSWGSYTQVVVGSTGPELVTTKMPPLRDQQAGYAALAVCLDKAAKLEAVDADDGAAEGRTMIGDLRTALGLAYDALNEQETATDTGPQ